MEVLTFVPTPLDSIPKIASSARNTFATHKTKPLEYRLTQLRKLYWAIKDNADAIDAACKKDLGRGAMETYMTETGWCANDCIFVQQRLEKWMQDEKPEDVPFIHSFNSPRIRKDPLGCILIIGAYNFPFQLTLGPLIGAIAAGCTAVLKPSETAPAAAAVVQRIVEQALDPLSYSVVQGAVPETTALLEEKWDKIFYTGGQVVGKIISKKAAETLTPVTLELGGLNPAIVTKNANIHLAARRLAWAKTVNVGQVCISQNYIMVDEEMVRTFVQEFKAALDEFFPNGTRVSPDYGRLVNAKTFQRMKKMLDASRGKILLGGSMEEAENFMEPTVVQVSDINDALLVEESFGPLIPVLPVKDLDTAIRHANELSVTPLGIYPFGNKKETERVLSETRSGGATINDGFFHGSIPMLPFGGVGQSGTGSYRGRSSFECFTHRRTVVTTPAWMDKVLAVRYPPFEGTGKLKQFRGTSEMKPNFDRNGKVQYGILRQILTLGGVSASSALTRWLVVVLCAVGYQRYQISRA